MNTPNIVAIDTTITIWQHSDKKRGHLPQSTRLVCSYWLDVILDKVEEQLYFHRTQSHDSLWTYIPNFGESKLVIKSQRAETPQASVIRLFRKLTLVRSGFEGPYGFIEDGLIDRVTYDQVVRDLSRQPKLDRLT